MSNIIVDARGLLCPMPVIRVQDCVSTLDAGELVEAVCSDPGALNDIPAWCRINGHRVVRTQEKDDEYIVVLEVGEL
ncbi:MAG: sulfurtransferase TusA family protein [Gammaproteobacteria bacterium]|nr:sulfurtransferase TusA family protein [Gammaproteobacteria bacterium]